MNITDFPMTKLVRHDSSSAERSRCGNLPIVVCKKNLYEVHWSKKYSDSTVGLYSAETKRVALKKNWGAVKHVVLESLPNKKGDTNDYLVCTNQEGDMIIFLL